MKRFVFVLMGVWLLAACTGGGMETEATRPSVESVPALATAVPPTLTPAPTIAIDATAVVGGVAEEELPVTSVAAPVTVDLSQVTSVPGEGPPQEAPKPGVPNSSAALVHLVSQDLATYLGIDVSQVALERMEEVVWPDGSLGCPEPEMAYTMALVPGFQIFLTANGQTYAYHTNEQQYFVLCGPKGQPLK